MTVDDIRSGRDLRQLVDANNAQYRRNRERVSSPRAMTSNGEAVFTASEGSREGVLVGIPVSHGGIIAREYGIPAVAGVPEATTLIRTGQLIRVDGGSGEVVVVNAVEQP